MSNLLNDGAAPQFELIFDPSTPDDKKSTPEKKATKL